MDEPFLLTVDVEPDWGMSGCRAVREVLPRLCDLFGRHRARATFFVVADLLESCGDALRGELAEHEVASHGLTHRVLAGMSEEDVARELSESRRRLEAAFRKPVKGFRAPFLRVPQGWFAALKKAGYGYDSSLGCVSPSPRNLRPAKWRIEDHDGVAEVPVTSLRTGWIPFSLTYLRLLSPVGGRLIAPSARILYFHLHELADPSLAGVLPFARRMILRRNAGPAAWEILERLAARFGARAVTCSELIATEAHKSREATDCMKARRGL